MHRVGQDSIGYQLTHLRIQLNNGVVEERGEGDPCQIRQQQSCRKRLHLVEAVDRQNNRDPQPCMPQKLLCYSSQAALAANCVVTHFDRIPGSPMQIAACCAISLLWANFLPLTGQQRGCPA